MSELTRRTLTAFVMLLVAGLAIALGGWPFALFVAAIGFAVFYEFALLVAGLTRGGAPRTIWIVAGCTYVGVACLFLIRLRGVEAGIVSVVTLLGAVIATDIGAYAAGRAIGGPKIAPGISPSKTWAGLSGAIVATTIWLIAISIATQAQRPSTTDGPPQDKFYALTGSISLIMWALGAGIAIAVVAQAGDFFESWMKRRAGVKDSGTVLPGHGGLFDRTDGLIAVLFVAAIVHWLVP